MPLQVASRAFSCSLAISSSRAFSCSLAISCCNLPARLRSNSRRRLNFRVPTACRRFGPFGNYATQQRQHVPVMYCPAEYRMLRLLLSYTTMVHGQSDNRYRYESFDDCVAMYQYPLVLAPAKQCFVRYRGPGAPDTRDRRNLCLLRVSQTG